MEGIWRFVHSEMIFRLSPDVIVESRNRFDQIMARNETFRRRLSAVQLEVWRDLQLMRDTDRLDESTYHMLADGFDGMIDNIADWLAQFGQ